MSNSLSWTRRLEIDVGHRLMRHDGKCRNVHGHRYAFEITCVADELDTVGRIIDFSAVKEVVGTWLDETMDHGFVYQEGDPIGAAIAADGSKVYEVPFPPTAENLAAYVLRKANTLLAGRGIKVMLVRCHETPNCYADAHA